MDEKGHLNDANVRSKRCPLTVVNFFLFEIIKEEEDKSIFTYLDCWAGHEFGRVCLQTDRASDFAILNASGEFF